MLRHVAPYQRVCIAERLRQVDCVHGAWYKHRKIAVHELKDVSQLFKNHELPWKHRTVRNSPPSL